MTDQVPQEKDKLEITKNTYNDAKAFFYPLITSIVVFFLVGTILANDGIRIALVAIFAVAVGPKLVARQVSNEVKAEDAYIFFQKVSDGVRKFSVQIWNIIVYGSPN